MSAFSTKILVSKSIFRHLFATFFPSAKGAKNGHFWGQLFVWAGIRLHGSSTGCQKNEFHSHNAAQFNNVSKTLRNRWATVRDLYKLGILTCERRSNHVIICNEKSSLLCCRSPWAVLRFSISSARKYGGGCKDHLRVSII